MQKKYFFIFLMSISFIFFNTNCLYAKIPFGLFPKTEINKVNEINKKFLYPLFFDTIRKKENFYLDKISATCFEEKNYNLIIGCSPVTYMYMFAKDNVSSFNYDIIGYGGACDSDLLSWLKALDKKYNTIVIWGSANDLFGVLNSNSNIENVYFPVLDDLILEAKKHLDESPGSKIIYVNVKDLTFGLDVTDENFYNQYNLLAKKTNSYIKKKGIKSLDITSDTSENNSEWYLHYTNKNVFIKILQDIELIK